MTFPRSRLLAGAALLVLSGLALRWSPQLLNPLGGPEPEETPVLAQVQAALAESPAGPTPELKAGDGVVNSAAPKDQRVSLDGAPAQEVETQVIPARDVAGVVLDHLGRTLVDVSVRLEGLPRPNTPWFSTRSRARLTPEQRTDEHGTFLFAGRPVEQGGKIIYGESLVYGPGFEKEIETDETWQELRVPDLASLTSHVILTVVSSQGQPVDVEGIEFSLPRSPPNGVRTPRAAIFPPEISLGRVDAWLGVGGWRAIVTARAGQRKAQDFRVAQAGGRVLVEVVLEVWEGAHSEVYLGNNIAPDAEDKPELPFIDVDRGLGLYLDGVLRMGYGADKWDRHFAQTLSFTPGPMKAATLTLTLKALSSMSSNDALYLEYLGERRFRYGKRIAELPGTGQWNRGESATVHLDLSQLPAMRDGVATVVDLLPDLEDGLLDVMLHDDTAVFDIELRVVR